MHSGFWEYSSQAKFPTDQLVFSSTKGCATIGSMKYPIERFTGEEVPEVLAPLREIPQPPKELSVRGKLPSEDLILLTVVGSRKFTNYGKEACEKLIGALAGHPVGIISGLALGIDAIAHRAALAAGLYTIGFPGSGLGWEVIHPKSNARLAHDILAAGGGLASEFPEDFKATLWSFPQRNRLMAGLAHTTLVIEAGEKSGTLITARLATEYNRNVAVVPGGIFSPGSKGSNSLLKYGAYPITSPADLLELLGLADDTQTQTRQLPLAHFSPEEQKIIDILREPTPRDALIRASGLPPSSALILLSALEIKGVIAEKMGRVYVR